MLPLPVMLARLLLAIVLGGLVGLERESSEHRAGMRTNALVAFGSALFTIISGYGFLGFIPLSHVQIDPTRIASYVIAGIGFLGGGAIVSRKGQVRGLTTAAAIWAVAAIGMVCGLGFYWESVGAATLTLAVLFLLRLLEQRLRFPSQFVLLKIWLETGQAAALLSGQIAELCQQRNVTVLKISMGQQDQREQVEIRCAPAASSTMFDLLADLRRLPGVVEGELDLRR